MVLLATGCTGAREDADPAPVTEEEEPASGGTLVFGAEQEPVGGLNGELACCRLAWQHWIVNEPILQGAYQQMPDFTFEPELLAGEAQVTEDPFTVTYTIHPEATWSDGIPVTAEDFVFTHTTIMDGEWDIASRVGHDRVEHWEIVDDKTVTFSFNEPYAAWKELFDQVYPMHALEGENFNTVWTEEIVNPKTGEPIGSGPFLFDRYRKGSELSLVRNDDYWGEHPAYLDEVVWRFLPGTRAQIKGLQVGKLDAIYPQLERELVELTGDENLAIQSSPGTVWEHIDIRLGKKGHPALKDLYVRKALAYGLNRQELASLLFQELSPGLDVLNNAIYMGNHSNYEAHWDTYAYNPDRATGLLEANGCTKGRDGIYECEGERLSFGFTSTTGDWIRELAFEIVQFQLKDVGIELRSEFGDPAVVFGRNALLAGDYDLFMFAWIADATPTGSVDIWSCGGSQNFMGYCDEEVSKLLEESVTLVDDAAHADTINQADALLAGDVPTIPLFQKPTFLAHGTDVHGMQDNPTEAGPSWNIAQWWIER